MKMQILTKKSLEDCADIIRLNVDTENWHWWSARTHASGFAVSGRVAPSDFHLKVRRQLPSFFTPVLKGVIEEEDNGTRLTIDSSLTWSSRILFILFAVVIFTLLLFEPPLPPQFRKSSLVVLSVVGIALFVIGKVSVKPYEKYLFTYLEELFEDDHILYS